jgi:hypothetical protein
MEAKARFQPPKPLEGVKGKFPASSENWRVKKKVTFEEVNDEEYDTPQIPSQQIRDIEKDSVGRDRIPRIEMPYKSVRPLNIGARTPPEFDRGNTQLRYGSSTEEKAYRVRAPIQRDGVTEDVIDHIHNTEVTVKLGDLFGLSKELREGERLQLTKVRQPTAPKKPERAPEVATMQVEEVPLPTEEVLDLPLGRDALDIAELPKVGVFVTTQVMDDVPVGSLVAQDPYLQYLESLSADERPKQVYVARESAPLQVIYPVINSNGSVESVLDSGSQIVSMSLDSAKQQGLIWDPGLRIFMESANKTMEESVGMARNVQFRWGSLTVYLQVHIIKNPAYQVLLGRPFDLLTKSQVENSTDGSQIVTITDPNTGKRCAIPTFNRGDIRRKMEESNKPDPSMDQDSNAKTTAFANGGFRRSSRN